MRQVVVLLVAVLTACGSALDVADRQTTTTVPVTATTTAATTRAPAVSTTAAPMRCGTEAEPFIGTGETTEVRSGAGDATTIATIGLTSPGTCERVTVDFLASGGAPATAVGAVELSVLPRIVRLSTSATSTAVADLVLGGALADTAYIVRRSNGSLSVDIHLTGPVSARVTLQRESGRAVIDMEPAGPNDASSGPVRSGTVVITSVSSAGYPVTVRGYARTFEANVLGQLRVEGEVVVETFGTAADWLDTWGAFDLRFDDGPGGTVELFVGEASPATGKLEGVSITLQLPEDSG